MTDRRTSERFALRGAAKIYVATSSFARDCLITDVSDGGVRFTRNAKCPTISRLSSAAA